MARIKVTGYLDEDDLSPEHLDSEHEMGLSTEGFDFWAGVFLELDDISFARVEEM